MSARRRPTILLSRLRAADDGEEGSLILVLLVMLIAGGLSVLVLGETVRQSLQTRFDAKRTRTLNAAQAGLEVGLGQIRCANGCTPTSTTNVGLASKLPCGPFSGAVSGDQTATYSVSIVYRADDGSDLTCTPGAGVTTVPKTAHLISDGFDVAYSGNRATDSGNRRLETDYLFRTDNTNVAGGPIHIFTGGGAGNLCIDAGSDTPAVGDRLLMLPCVTGAPRQRFAYLQNLGLYLTSSASGATALCITAADATEKPNVSGVVATLETCAFDKAVAPVLPATQIWSYDDNYQFTAAASVTSKGGTYLTMTQPNVSGSTLQLVTSNYSQWSPEPTVGSGKAPDANKSVMGVSVGVGTAGAQLVNYKEFGRCWDVTNQNVGTGAGGGSFLINYPCKQTPNPAGPAWNELLTNGDTRYPGALVTYQYGDTSKPYCMKSTGKAALDSSAFVTVVPCPATITQAFKWTFSGTSGYATGYRILDGYSNCLDITTTDTYVGWSKLTTNTCSASLSQKWNAPANLVASSTDNLIEKPHNP